MNILILTGRFGQGHVSAAKAVEAQVQAAFPGARVQVVDFLRYALKGDSAYRAFETLVRHGGPVFNKFYYRTEKPGSSLGVPMKPVCYAAFGRLLRRHRPDVVISTLLFTSQLAGQYKRDKGCLYTLITTMTDTAVHSDWIAPGTDAYMVPSEDTRRELMAAGVPGYRIFITGVPLRAGFYPGTPKIRQGLGQRRELLILGGGLGIIPGGDDFWSALSQLEGVHVTVLCGGNQELADRLRAEYPDIEAVGFVTNVGDYMRRADLAVGKPGGATLFELIACGLPLASFEPFLAQEVYNAHFVDRRGLGLVLKGDTQAQVDTLRRLIWSDIALAAMGRAMADLRQSFKPEALIQVIQMARRCTLAAG